MSGQALAEVADATMQRPAIPDSTLLDADDDLPSRELGPRASVTAPVYLSACSACAAYPAGSIWATEVLPGCPFYCPRCRPGLLTGEEQLVQPHPVVGFLDGARETRWCVLEIRANGRFLARLLGLPDSPAVERHVSEVRPIFSYAKLERARRGTA